MSSDPVPIAQTLAQIQRNLARVRPPALKAEPEAARLLREAGEEMPPLDAMRDEMREARWQAVCPSRFLWARLEDFAPDPAVFDPLDEWSSNPAGRNLVLFGPVGAGKTHAALAACRPLVEEHGLDMLFLPTDELLDRVWSRSEAESFWEMCGADLLVIDDLGSERKSEFATSRIYAIINRRWAEERPTIVTTNADPRDDSEDGLEAIVGPRTFSRLVGGAVAVLLSGEDRRRVAP